MLQRSPSKLPFAARANPGEIATSAERTKLSPAQLVLNVRYRNVLSEIWGGLEIDRVTRIYDHVFDQLDHQFHLGRCDAEISVID